MPHRRDARRTLPYRSLRASGGSFVTVSVPHRWLDDDVIIDAPRIELLFKIRKRCNLTVLQPAFDPRGKVSHAVTCVQPGNQLRLTNFVEMTCPLFAAPALCSFIDQFDSDLKGWGADWWFLTVCARAMADASGASRSRIPATRCGAAAPSSTRLLASTPRMRINLE